MRLKSLLAAAAASALAGFAMTAPAAAFDLGKWDAFRAPEGYDHSRVIHHWIYKPHYRHQYHLGAKDDPYAYRYAPRKYYPYYGSNYWVPAEQMRNRYRYSFDGPKYRYQPSWGQAKHDVGHGHDGKPSK